MSVLELPDDPDGIRRQGGLLVPWPRFVAEIVPDIRPDEHITFLARTRWGKSWLMRHLLELTDAKRRVMLFDLKNMDPLWRQGFKLVKGPPNWLEKQAERARRLREEEGERREWVRVVPPDSYGQARQLVNSMMERAYRWGSTRVVFDEVKAVTGRSPNLNLERQANKLWQRGLANYTSVWAGSQSPVWVPRTSFDEIAHIFVGKINDVARLRRIGEIGSKELAELVPTLKRYQFAYRNLTDDILVVIQAPATMPGGAIAQRAAGDYRFKRLLYD